jgi:hypothetical protein
MLSRHYMVNGRWVKLTIGHESMAPKALSHDTPMADGAWHAFAALHVDGPWVKLMIGHESMAPSASHGTPRHPFR